jgi:ketosteroid isomerase-like protein
MPLLARDTGPAMSQENVEVVRDAFDAFTRGDVEGVLQRCDEDIVITQPRELPVLGASPQQRGHSGVLEAFAIWPEQWDDFRIEIARIVADPGDYVVVATRQRGRGKQSGVEVEIEMTFVFTVRDKRVVEWQMFMREDQALEAAGLSESV